MSRRSRRRGRPVNGVILLDKPTGITSNAALQQVKSIYFAEKAGHTGALDPLATGMLPICLGEATKFSQYLLNSDKKYQVIAKLGERTNTSDADGEIISTRDVTVSIDDIKTACNNFIGDIKQIPSMYSALKHNGRPLYEYAREGIDIPREARPITVFSLEILDFDLENSLLTMEIHCSKGTYIRTIVDDLGELLKCGAHVAQLRRIQVANYPADKMITLEFLEELLEKTKNNPDLAPKDLLDPLLLPVDTAVQSLPEVNIDQTTASYVMHGQPVLVTNSPSEGQVRITVGTEKEFIGIGEINDDGLVAPKRLVR